MTGISDAGDGLHPDPTLRFTDRVDDYERYRPGYPEAILDVLRDQIGLAPGWVVADVGSGTGLSTELFLGHGHMVYAVEPNDAMRGAAERRLDGRPGFRSVGGTAERTGLADASVDLVVAAQAFHWFEPARTRAEFARVLGEPKWAALIWNSRHTESTDFLRAYESLLSKHGTNYQEVRHEWKKDGSLEQFFQAGFERAVLPNEQVLDDEGLRGRSASASYLPGPGCLEYDALLADLRALFDAHAVDGRVRLTYDCEIFTGRLRDIA
jgi:SAM-dependent methyltransferase